MWGALYTSGVRAYGLAIYAASIWRPKAKLWVKGRKEQKLEPESTNGPCLWMHCASVGEFEQGRPLLERIKSDMPNVPVMLTFFSPSGYEMHKNYPKAEKVLYLPLDTPANVKRFISMHNPGLAIFVKYEVWHNCYRELNQRGIPTYMVSAKFRADQVYFIPWGNWFANTLRKLSGIFTQDETSVRLLSRLGIQATKTGDTRFDRVLQIAKRGKDLPEIAWFKNNKNLLVAGSTWPADEAILIGWWKSRRKSLDNWKLIIVPHEIGEDHIADLMKLTPEARRFTDGIENDSSILILDTMGMLSALYRYADLAYVGGGFGAGIHNVLEPAAFGNPVIFGPKHQKFDEATGLIQAGGAFSEKDGKGLIAILDDFTTDKEKRKAAGISALSFVQNGAGATDKILKVLTPRLEAMAP